MVAEPLDKGLAEDIEGGHVRLNMGRKQLTVSNVARTHHPLLTTRHPLLPLCPVEACVRVCHDIVVASTPLPPLSTLIFISAMLFRISDVF
jgi:hypothetical protein